MQDSCVKSFNSRMRDEPPERTPVLRHLATPAGLLMSFDAGALNHHRRSGVIVSIPTLACLITDTFGYDFRIGPLRNAGQLAMAMKFKPTSSSEYCAILSERCGSRSHPIQGGVIPGSTIFESQADAIHDVVRIAVRVAKELPFDLCHKRSVFLK